MAFSFSRLPCLSPATPPYSCAISTSSPRAHSHLVKVGEVGVSPRCPAANACIFHSRLPVAINSKNRKQFSSQPASIIPAVFAERRATFAKDVADDRREKGASDADARSVRVSFNPLFDGGHRDGYDELSEELAGREVNAVLNFEGLQGNGSLIVDDAEIRSNKEGEKGSSASRICYCQVRGRRAIMASLGGFIASSGNFWAASASSFESSDYNAIRETVHPAKPSWYEELYAQTMAKTMVSYEGEVADYKRQLFHLLDETVQYILELGVGTGSNFKYYGNMPHLQRVVGVDPNLQMAKYCTESAAAAGLSNSQFEFLHAVGEGIPVRDESIDAVVCTLTLCSVSDVTLALEEVKRVLKPGGAFLFVEHVAAPDGTGLRFWQGLLDPLQQWVADGCHLTRNTLHNIEKAQFGSVQSERFTVASVSLIGPHIMGVAYK